MENVKEILESITLLLRIVNLVYKFFKPIEDKKEPGHGQNVK
jgi:hypothetical protein